MAKATFRKKTVGNQPFCTARQIRLIDPVWLCGPVPFRFWEDPVHRREYLLWLGYRLGFRRMVDWYRLTNTHFSKHCGGAVLQKYWKSHIKAVGACFPEYEWHEWLFTVVPEGFWDVEANGKRYMQWLGQKLGYTKLTDWYQLSTADLHRNRGATLLIKYKTLPRLMRKLLPPFNWEHLDPRRPLAIKQILQWADLHYAQYRKWPNGCSRRVEGMGITWSAVCERLRLAKHPRRRYGSLREILVHYRGLQCRYGRPKLTVKQILQWADAYFQYHGRWPSAMSGPIPGTDENWSKVQAALFGGTRGLPGGSSLPQLLQQRRGTRRGSPFVALSEKQILAWADAYFASHGKWPTDGSGTIPRTKQTWAAIDLALRRGYRALPGGSSLPQLLNKRRRTVSKSPAVAVVKRTRS